MKVPYRGWLERPVPDTVLRWEGALVCLVAWGLLLSIPLFFEGLGLGWDALNHHIYLGWTAQQHRFDRDFLGAGYQSFQSPYVNWPVYKLAVNGLGGATAGSILASLHLLVVWPVWMLARVCVPGGAVFDVAMRSLGVALALMSGVVLSALGSTMNDVLATAPLLWAVALAMEPIARSDDVAPQTTQRYVLLSGLGTGLAVALKLSNGPLAILMPGLWLLCGPSIRGRLFAVFLGSLGTVAGFLIGYGYWGSLLWRYFGNPVFPFYHHLFAPLRSLLGWTG